MLVSRLQYNNNNNAVSISSISNNMHMNTSNVTTNQSQNSVIVTNNSNNNNSSSTSTSIQKHVDQLLTTAAGGTGLIGDISPAHNLSMVRASNTDLRPERNLWRTEEIIWMLKIMMATNALEKLNDKTIKSDRVFRRVEEMMHKNGYRKKSHVQIWTKWKFLKSTYNTTKRNGTVPKMIPVEVYELLCEMLDGFNMSSNGNLSGGGGGASSDCGNSVNSMDDNNSNGANSNSNGAGVVNATSSQQHRLVLTGIKQDCSRRKTNTSAETGEESNDLNMAHPIFGFRLGIVKPEPADIGYETAANNDTNSSDKDASDNNNANNITSSSSASDHIPFQSDIKVELEETTITQHVSTPSSAMVSITPTSAAAVGSTFNKRQITVTPVPIVTSTPQQHQQSLVQRNPQLPPLRVAPFAKEPNMSNTMQRIDRPPPPLSMSPNIRPNRHLNFNNGNIQAKKLLLPKLAQQALSNYGRQSKEVNVQPSPQRNTSFNPSMLRLKQVPMRKTPYSLRPERMIPDLDQSISPPPSPVPKSNNLSLPSLPPQQQTQQFNMYNPDDMATTTRNAQQLNLLNQHKRRLALSTPDIPTKLPRYSYDHRVPTNAESYNDMDMADDDNCDDDDDYTDEDDDESSQAHTSKDGKSKRQKEHEEFEMALSDLATSLRHTQRKMLVDFFDHQKELARKEHEFQMKQDMLIMKAFREQTQQLMASAKKMLDIELIYTPEKKSTTNLESKANADKSTCNDIVSDKQKTNFSVNEENQLKALASEVHKSEYINIKSINDESNETVATQQYDETDHLNMKSSYELQNIAAAAAADADECDAIENDIPEEYDDQEGNATEDDAESEHNITHPIELVSSVLAEDN